MNTGGYLACVLVRQNGYRTNLTPTLTRFYRRLLAYLGPQHWWPGRTRFEVILGAILTQNTSWGNVEKALANLRPRRLLAPRPLARLSALQLRTLLRPCGYFRQKASTVAGFLDYLGRHHRYSVNRMFRKAPGRLRRELLALRGIGEETTDSILLYAGGRPVFVIDAYTRRILLRHGLASPQASYGELQELFEKALPRSAKLYNEYHALLVAAGKRYCHRRQPDCAACPLGPELGRPYARL